MATDHDSKICAREILKTISFVERALCSVKSKLKHCPLAYPERLLPLTSRWGGNLIIRVFIEVRNFDPHEQGMGYLN